MRSAFPITAVTAFLLFTAPAIAQSPAGNPSDPTTNQNQQIGPSVPRPTDPAAGDNPAARVPTSPVERDSPSGQGVSTGETGSPEVIDIPEATPPEQSGDQ